MAYTRKEYLQSEEVNQAQQAVLAQQEAKPGQYQSAWQSQIQEILGKLQNRQPFQYHPGQDGLYRQLQQQGPPLEMSYKGLQGLEHLPQHRHKGRWR